jgi:hypothetical protein
MQQKIADRLGPEKEIAPPTPIHPLEEIMKNEEDRQTP